jgi:hypothetical protein
MNSSARRQAGLLASLETIRPANAASSARRWAGFRHRLKRTEIIRAPAMHQGASNAVKVHGAPEAASRCSSPTTVPTDCAFASPTAGQASNRPTCLGCSNRSRSSSAARRSSIVGTAPRDAREPVRPREAVARVKALLRRLENSVRSAADSAARPDDCAEDVVVVRASGALSFVPNT